MYDESDSERRDLAREREDATTVVRGVAISASVAMTTWIVVVAVTWQLANVVLSVLS